jgi:transposase
MIRLTDEQWECIRKHFPEEHIADGRPGRKPVPTRRVLEAVLWILSTGAQWHMLPQSYPNYKTVHRRFSVAPPTTNAGVAVMLLIVQFRSVPGEIAFGRPS